jgi:hypothetical protein
MDNLRQAIKTQFGCTKSWLKMHDFRLVVDNHYTVREWCIRCHQQRA